MTRREIFGLKLSQHRERCGTSLESISSDTKIGRALLVGLEQGDCSRWPPGVYSRAYVRSYAHAVGLDEDDVVAEFCECFPELALRDAPPDSTLTDRRAYAGAGGTVSPLRLSLAGPPERRSRGLSAVAMGLSDLAVIGVLALVLTATGLSFWTAAAAVSILCSLLVSVWLHRSLVESLVGALRQRRLGGRTSRRAASTVDGSARPDEGLSPDPVNSAVPDVRWATENR